MENESIRITLAANLYDHPIQLTYLTELFLAHTRRNPEGGHQGWLLSHATMSQETLHFIIDVSLLFWSIILRLPPLRSGQGHLISAMTPSSRTKCHIKWRYHFHRLPKRLPFIYQCLTKCGGACPPKPITSKAMASPCLWCETYGFVEKCIIPVPQQVYIKNGGRVKWWKDDQQNPQ